jgi:hypothetical protein
MHEHDSAPHGTRTDPAVARFYDTVRSGTLSAAALAHGDADIGQACVLTPEEILAFARRVGITARTSVLDIGSGTGGRRATWPSSWGVVSWAWICRLWAMPRP